MKIVYDSTLVLAAVFVSNYGCTRPCRALFLGSAANKYNRVH